jgi:hypothetical protein
MKIARNLLISSVLSTLLLASSVAASGCVVHGRTHTRARVAVRSEPPPPRAVYVEPRSGYVWVEGRWVWDDYGSEWVWYDGYWIQDRPGYYYVAGRWDLRGSRYVWVQPRWVSRADRNVTVRVTDHSRPTKVRIRENSGRRVPNRPR